jgi:REP element-mobilizing transposase RayT
MPDHVHWLLVLKRGNLGRSVHNVKCLSNRLADTRIEWQDGFFDHCIRDTNSLRFTARYIVANPLRAELVDNIGLYSHWDAAWLDETFSLHL